MTPQGMPGERGARSIVTRLNAVRRAYLRQENRKYPAHLVAVPQEEWPDTFRLLTHQPTHVWRSRDFLVQVYPPRHGAIRLSICRTILADDGSRMADGIRWDDLQRLKAECGFADRDAAEIFPAEIDVVNVANMRHLWVLVEPLPFKWTAQSEARGLPPGSRETHPQ